MTHPRAPFASCLKSSRWSADLSISTSCLSLLLLSGPGSWIGRRTFVFPRTACTGDIFTISYNAWTPAGAPMSCRQTALRRKLCRKPSVAAHLNICWWGESRVFSDFSVSSLGGGFFRSSGACSRNLRSRNRMFLIAPLAECDLMPFGEPPRECIAPKCRSLFVMSSSASVHHIIALGATRSRSDAKQ